MKRVFVDTGAFFAVLVTEDLHHERARVIMSFVVMARLGITDAIAFDRHFAEYGRFALL